MSRVPPRRASRTLWVLAAATVATLAASGCGTAGEEEARDADTDRRGAAEEDIVVEAHGDAQYGGRLTYGLEAETDGFRPDQNRWAISGMMVALAVYDPLVALDAEGQPQPYLAESVEPNEDFDVWTITLRPDIQFHDGEPLTSEAVVETLRAHTESFLTSTALLAVDEVVAIDDLTAEVRMHQPWVSFDASLTSQIGFIPSPRVFEEEALSREPVGTGPFEYREWVPNARFLLARNDNYWREGLPYLDEVEFQPITEQQSRVRALDGGSIDMFHTASARRINEFRERGGADGTQLFEDRGNPEKGFVLLNTEREPLDDPRVRRAIAHATDTESYVESVAFGVPEVSEGLFLPDSDFYVDTDYPAFDLAEAERLVQEYIADPDTPDEVAFELATTPGTEALNAVQTLDSMWQRAGMDVTITTVDQAEFIGTAVGGDFYANLWRQFGAPDPDVDMVWWLGWAGETEEGEPQENILNFARNRNPEIDELLQQGRQTPDHDERVEIYGEFQRILNEEDIPYIWLTHTMWGVIADESVRDITNGPLPDGTESMPMGGVGTFGGVHRVTQIWLEQ